MKRKYTIILLFISLYVFIFSLVSTYARYSSEYEKLTTLNLTKWKLYVNNSDIANNSDISQNITPTFISNPHIAENVIVPMSEGYFDLEIDCSNTDLSFSYTINIDTSVSEIADFKLIGYSINNGEMILTQTPEITGEILYSDNIDIISFRIYIKWDDSENNITNNIQDTQLSINNSTACVNVNISFEQIIDTYNF